ncbi:MAG: serine/threonine protein kinase [Hydrogenophilaceae bacterium]|nr:serine/threonine protein kinase [Hydrogenophilaceae bacterium]
MAAQSTDKSTDPLPAGFRLDAYTIQSKIGGGGFGLVYLAHDGQGRPVAIKEYLPIGVVARQADGSVQPLSEADQGVFRYGMRCFFEESRALATLSHPNVVRVLNFFRANNTVYLAMRYEQGNTLHKLIHAEQAALLEPFITTIFIQLLNGLREVHARKLLHLDIKPANIFIRTDGSPLLIDFGSARQALAQGPAAIAPMYTPGFAAPELYKERDRLGPWTDIYAIGASMYVCLAKATPPAADQRLQGDTLSPAAQTFAGLYSEGLLQLIDASLQLSDMERPQSVFAVQKRLVELAREAAEARPNLLAILRSRMGWR